MEPVLVVSIHDPQGLIFPHLEAVMPDLQRVFARTCANVTDATRRQQPEHVRRLEGNPFFDVVSSAAHDSLRDQWLTVYARAAAICHPDQILHLCSIDRVAFALQSAYREQFVADVRSLTAGQTPFIYHRSAAAWATHPSNYRELEQIVTRTGEYLFGKTLDFGWCHMALQARTLQAILSQIKNHDISMVAEFVLLLRDSIRTKDVDWLAWEDPFIFGRAAEELKREREQSITETRKRLAYVIPMLKLLDEAGGSR